MRTKQSGMSLAELLLGVAILGTLILATMNVTTAIMRNTKTNMDRQFATQKAISMLEELKALVQVNTAIFSSVPTTCGWSVCVSIETCPTAIVS